MKQTKTKIPEGVRRVRNAVTGEVKHIAPKTIYAHPSTTWTTTPDMNLHTGEYRLVDTNEKSGVKLPKHISGAGEHGKAFLKGQKYQANLQQSALERVRADTLTKCLVFLEADRDSFKEGCEYYEDAHNLILDFKAEFGIDGAEITKGDV